MHVFVQYVHYSRTSPSWTAALYVLTTADAQHPTQHWRGSPLAFSGLLCQFLILPCSHQVIMSVVLSFCRYNSEVCTHRTASPEIPFLFAIDGTVVFSCHPVTYTFPWEGSMPMQGGRGGGVASKIVGPPWQARGDWVGEGAPTLGGWGRRRPAHTPLFASTGLSKHGNI